MQIVSLECDQLKKDTTWFHSDSLVSIEYFYYTRGGKIIFSISNLSNKPIFLDGKNSFVLIGNKKMDYWNDIAQVNENLLFYGTNHFRLNDPITGTITKAERVSLIPPKSSIIIGKYTIQNERVLFDLSKCQTTSDSVQINWEKGSKKRTGIKKATFEQSKSPVTFRNFISLSKTEDFKDPIYYDYTFWISEILEMDSRQATKSTIPEYYCDGAYFEYGKEKSEFHPYKKPWRFYINTLTKP
jgi:hypothetical protein